MSQVKEILAAAEKQTGLGFIGLERKTARIKSGSGSELKDILGWDVLVRGENGACYEYYAAQPPLIGMTQPQPAPCPLGIVAFDGYKIGIEEAIKIFHTQNGGDKFTAITLSWPLVHPAAHEPFWYFRTNPGGTVIIGANSGQIQGVPINILLYMAQPPK